MRHYAILAVVLAGCALRKTPYRFGSPMLGSAQVPPPPINTPRSPSGALRGPAEPDLAIGGRPSADQMPHEDPIQNRTAAAVVMRKPMPAPIAARPGTFVTLPAPHQLPPGEPLPAVHEPAELRELVGRRDKGTPVIAALAWCSELGIHVEGTTGPELVERAEAAHRLAPPTSSALPGDLLVFDHTDSDDPADLVANAIDRDHRGVIEFIYVGGGVVRRGFVDPHRPSIHRDATGATVNTFLRWGKRWPPAGTHYLAGELLSHVIRAR